MYTLKDLRKNKLIDIKTICDIIGVKKTQYYNIEYGKAIIYTNELRQIAEYCNIKVSEISTDNLKVVSYGI